MCVRERRRYSQPRGEKTARRERERDTPPRYSASEREREIVAQRVMTDGDVMRCGIIIIHEYRSPQLNR